MKQTQCEEANWTIFEARPAQKALENIVARGRRINDYRKHAK